MFECTYHVHVQDLKRQKNYKKLKSKKSSFHVHVIMRTFNVFETYKNVQTCLISKNNVLFVTQLC